MKFSYKIAASFSMVMAVLSGAVACRKQTGMEGMFEYSAGWLSAELTSVIQAERKPLVIAEADAAVEDAGKEKEQQPVRLVIPDKLGGKRVRSVAAKAFQQCTNAVSVKIPFRVSRIGVEAFEGCSELVWAELPSHLERMEDGLFSNCSRMLESDIPERVEEIGARAYSGCVRLRRVAVPEGVRSVGAQAFAGCESLGRLDLPPGVTVLGPYAFRGCKSLQAFALPPRLTNLGEGLFADCSGLGHVEIPAGVLELGADAFKGCASLASVVLPAGLVSIGAGVFADCRSLEHLEFPPGIANIPDGAFEGCRGLRSVSLPAGVTNIGARAFAGCVMLEEIELPEGVQSVGKEAFDGCVGLKRMTVPSGVAALEDGVFGDCGALAAISLVPGLETVCEDVFRNCSSLKEVLLPKTVRKVHPRAFSGCSALEAVDVAEGNPLCCSRDGVLFGDGGVELLHFPGARCGTYTVPDGVKRIAPEAFRASGVEGVRVPDGVESIGAAAFRDCHGLQWVALADGIRELGDGAFMGCHTLWELVVPGSVERLGKDLVSGCGGLLMLVLPDNLSPEPQREEVGASPDCTICPRSGWEAVRRGKWLEDAHDPFYGFYAGEELDTVSFEGTVLAISAVPDPAGNDYDDCLYAILVELDSLLSPPPTGRTVERVVLVNVPIMRNRIIVHQNRFGPGDKISCTCASYDAMPQAIREIQLSDDIQTFEYQQYYPLAINAIPSFQKTGNRDFAKREIAVLPLRSLPRDAGAAAARRKRIQSEIARIESELARHGGSFEAWKEEYKSIAEKYGQLCGDAYAAWTNDSFFAARGRETSYMTQEYIEGLLPYKRYLEENNVDLIILRVPSKWDFAARVLAAEDFQENPAWVEHCYACLKNDIEIVDPMPEMWKERFEFPLFYFFNVRWENHPFEGTAFVSAKVLADVLERYQYPKSEEEICLMDAGFETDDFRFFWPPGNEKFNPAENLSFKQVVRNNEPIGNLSDQSGSPFVFLSNSYFWYPQRPLGASVPGYTAYFMQAIPDWCYQDGSHNSMIRNLFSWPSLLDSRKAVVMVGSPGDWKEVPPMPKYILDRARRITLEKEFDIFSDELTMAYDGSCATVMDSGGGLLYVEEGTSQAEDMKHLEIAFNVPAVEGKSTCMVRVNFSRPRPVGVDLVLDTTGEIIDTCNLSGQSADLFLPLPHDGADVKVFFFPQGHPRACFIRNIELWYY